jgi:transcriptional regulator with XRE-family HTH domain
MMNKKETRFIDFLNEVMRRRKRSPSRMAADIGISHATVSRWLSGKDVPSTRSCRKLAEYIGTSFDKVLSVVGHMPEIPIKTYTEWPEFREYARIKYPNELDEDLISIIEDLIERRRVKKQKDRKI